MSFHFLRLAIPSWRFFDNVQHRTCLQFRTRDGNVWSEWLEPSLHQPSIFARLFFNPTGNWQLALGGLNSRLVEEINLASHASEIAASTSYRLVNQSVRKEVQTMGRLEGTLYQFRIQILRTDNGDLVGTSLISEQHQL